MPDGGEAERGGGERGKKGEVGNIALEKDGVSSLLLSAGFSFIRREVSIWGTGIGREKG